MLFTLTITRSLYNMSKEKDKDKIQKIGLELLTKIVKSENILNMLKDMQELSLAQIKELEDDIRDAKMLDLLRKVPGNMSESLIVKKIKEEEVEEMLRRGEELIIAEMVVIAKEFNKTVKGNIFAGNEKDITKQIERKMTEDAARKEEELKKKMEKNFKEIQPPAPNSPVI